MSLKLLDTINYGYGHLEPVIIGLMAIHRNFILIGRHGSGKSRIARILSQGYGKQGFVMYDATKDDLLTIAGIPDPRAMQEGRLGFTPHQRTIWDKSTVVVDEITRAAKENQNLWLEILEEKTCFGLPLSYRTLIATANPESYAAAFRLDDALLDRFNAVLPIPDGQIGMDATTIEQVVNLSLGEPNPLEAETLARIFAEIQTAYKVMYNGAEGKKVITYVSRMMAEILAAQNKKNDEEKNLHQRPNIRTPAA